MNRTILRCLSFVAIIASASAAFPQGAENKVAIYVATNGKDTWSGRRPEANKDGTDGPLATLKRARDQARAAKRIAGNKVLPVTVFVRGGKYFLDDTLRLTEKDSGTAECRVCYTAYPDERPILSGGRPLAGWKPCKGEIRRCEVPETRGNNGWKFRSLFLGGKRQIRARYPNLSTQDPFSGGDWVYTEAADEENPRSALVYRAGSFSRRWAKPRQGEIFIWPYGGWGDTCTIPIQSIDCDKRRIVMTQEIRNFEISPWFYPTLIQGGNRFRVENVLEELDEPGEWCLDSEEGVVYFWPPDKTFDPKNAEVVAPVLRRLIDLRGCSHVTVSNFVLTETAGEGDSSHPPALDGVRPMGSETLQGRPYCGEAIHLENASFCTIENNRIHAVGGNGIYLQQYTLKNVIRYNEIDEAGANGVALAGALEVTGGARRGVRHPVANRITDNHIHHCGIFDAFAAGVFLGRSEATMVAHNEIDHMPHHGINLGNDGFGRNILQFNKIHHVTLLTQDTGAINCWMEGPRESERTGHVIRYNYIADNPGERGIYLDNSTSNCFVYGNVIVRTKYGIFFRCKNHVIENNILVGCDTAAIHQEGDWFHDGWFASSNNRICTNIICPRTASAKLYLLATDAAAGGLAECDYNLLFNTGGESCLLERQGKTVSLNEWRKTGFDTHSLVADPLFVDPAKDDYRLKPDSPALKLGFQPIDVSKIGIRKSPAN